MGLKDAIGLTCVLALVVASPVAYVRHWRGKGRSKSVRHYGIIQLSFWARRGMRRIMLATGLGFLPLLISVVVVFGLRELDRPLPDSAQAWIIVAAFVWMLMVFIFAIPLIILSTGRKF